MRHRETLHEEIVSVSNVNSFPVTEHMALLNLNDDKHEYTKYHGEVEID